MIQVIEYLRIPKLHIRMLLVKLVNQIFICVSMSKLSCCVFIFIAYIAPIRARFLRLTIFLVKFPLFLNNTPRNVYSVKKLILFVPEEYYRISILASLSR